jgi:hypothetical protein
MVKEQVYDLQAAVRGSWIRWISTNESVLLRQTKNLIKVQTDIKVEISSMRSNRSTARANSEWSAVLYCAVRNTVGTRFYAPDPPRLRAIDQSGLTVEPES